MSPETRSSRSSLYIALGLLSGLGGFLIAYRRLTRRPFSPPTGQDAPRAVVTGASSGIGAAFARLLAARGYDLLLVARREDRLNGLAAELDGRHGVDVQISPADLSTQAGIDFTARAIQALPRVDLLVNNAGFGDPGPFYTSDVQRQMEMVRLHDVASLALTHAALPGMLARGSGAVINVSSTASFFPLPWNATYSASKSFLNVFSEALQSDLAGKGVFIQALCPGFVRTEFHDREDGLTHKLPGILFMQPEDVACRSLDALGRGTVVFVPGLGNRLISLVGQTPFSRSLSGWVARAALLLSAPSQM